MTPISDNGHHQKNLYPHSDGSPLTALGRPWATPTVISPSLLLTYDLTSTGKNFDDDYGIDITGAGYQTIEIALKSIPSGDEAAKLVDRILQFDPDIQQDGRDPTRVIDLNYNNGRIALWWD